MQPDAPLPLRLLPFPDGLYLVNDSDCALPQLVMSSRAWWVFEDVDKTFGGESVHSEVRDLPARSRLMWQEIPVSRADDVQYQILHTRFWIESADGVDLPPNGRYLPLGKAPTDSMRARIFGSTPDPAWDYGIVERERTVVRREPGSVVGPDRVFHPNHPSTPDAPNPSDNATA